MTKEQIRIAVAEACGWKFEKHSNGVRLIDPAGRIVNQNYAEAWRVPNYPESLDAMHDAVRATLLKESEMDSFMRYLCVVRGARMPFESMRLNRWFRVFVAHPHELAEALLRTLSRWEEE